MTQKIDPLPKLQFLQVVLYFPNSDNFIFFSYFGTDPQTTA